MQLFLKIYFCVFFILIFILLTNQVQAALPAMRPFCPQSEWCVSGNCSGQGAQVHRVKIYTNDADNSDRKPLPGTNSYILECFPTGNNKVCTTGNSSQDNYLFARDNTAILETEYGYKFEGLFKADGSTILSLPVDTKNGKLQTVEWQSLTQDGVDRTFMGVNVLTAQDIGGTCVGDASASQCLLKLMEIQGVCQSTVRWDPYGRVFDSQSLEPIADAKVTLYKKNTRGSYDFLSDPLIPNPVTTKNTGDFNFAVPDGTYRLTVEKTGFNFPFNSVRINTNFDKAYSDLYYGTSSATIKNQNIVQRGSIVHVDIPLDSNGAPYTSQEEIVNYATQVDRAHGSYLVMNGRVTHPFALIQAFNKITNEIITSTSAGKLGDFELRINQQNINPLSGCCRIETAKVDLNRTLLNKISWNKISSVVNKLLSFVQVKAQTNSSRSINIDPIPNYVEGYTYVANGQVIPNATVGVYLTFSNKPLFETKADEKGFFKIGSQNLPSLPYVLRFTSATGAVTKKTTTKFLTENQNYLGQSEINLFKVNLGATNPKVDSTIIPNPSVSQSTGINFIEPTAAKQISGTSAPILIGAILLALVGTTGAILGLYLIRKRKTDSF